jgi:hypothetical protein
MTSTRTTTSSVLERFPDDWYVIVELCRENEDFRELCDHYTECTAVIARLRKATDPDSRQLTEYEDLTKELEQEIRKTVDAISRQSVKSDANAKDRSDVSNHE